MTDSLLARLPCQRCFGTGYIPSETCDECPDCQDRCPACDGTGFHLASLDRSGVQLLQDEETNEDTRVDKLCSDLPRGSTAAENAVISAAKALLERLEFVHADSQYQSVWVIAQIHVGPYAGPKYDKELAALRLALAKAEGR